MIPALPDCKIVGVFGPVASGKTHLIRQWLSSLNRFVIFDYTGEFQGSMETFFANPKAMFQRLRQNPYFFQIAYVPGKYIEADFESVLWSLWMTPTFKYLICDEFHRIAPNDGSVDDSVETMLRFARHAHLGVVGASQRIADVSKLFTSSCRMTVLFKTQEARDLDAIEDRWGCAQLVSDLRGLIYDDATQTVKQIPQCVICERGQAPIVVDLG